MLTFDEFRAVNNREKARTEARENEKKKKRVATKLKATGGTGQNGSSTKDGRKQDGDDSDGKSKPIKLSYVGKAVQAIGEFLEIHQMQSLYVLIVIIDTFASMAEIYISSGPDFQLQSLLLSKKVIVRLLASFTTFTLLFYALEICAVMVVFRLSMFSHWGYSVDVIVTGSQLYMEQTGFGRASRLLNVFRLWRLLRVLNSMLYVEREANEHTSRLLEDSQTELLSLRAEADNLRSDIVKEKEARDAIESMLQNYKEEVDTLNEALKIAAMDIAEVAQADDDDLMPLSDGEEGELDDDDVEDVGVEGASKGDGGKTGGRRPAAATTAGGDDAEDEFEEAVTSKYSKAGNKAAVMRAVMADAQAARGRAAAGAAAGQHGPPTFLVHEDGTFEQK